MTTRQKIASAIEMAARTSWLDTNGMWGIEGYPEDFADAVLAAFPVDEMLAALRRLAEAKAVKRERGVCSLYKRRKKAAWVAVEAVLAKIDGKTV